MSIDLPFFMTPSSLGALDKNVTGGAMAVTTARSCFDGGVQEDR